jgi:hypothetical protein
MIRQRACISIGKYGRAGALMLALLAGSRTAAAEPSVPERWYGDFTLLADGGALALLLASIAVNDRDTREGVLVMSGVTYLVGAPVVHLTRQRAMASLGSLGLRAGMPALGALLGSQLSGLADYNDGDEVVIGTVYGVLGGILSAVVLDAAFIAWEPLSPSEGASARSEPSWSPSLVLTNTHAGLGVAGRF